MGLAQLDTATPYDFVVFWGIEMIIAGRDDSGGGPNAFVTDADGLFVENNIVPGAVIRNLTTGIEGRVTTVTSQTVLQTSTATWSTGNEYNIAPMDWAEYRVVELSLKKAIGTVAMALTAAGADAASYSTYGLDYLKNLVMLIAVVVHNAPCKGARIDPAQRQQYMEWIQTELTNIRTGKTEVVQGYTGADFPALGWAEQGVTEWAAAQIVFNRIRRTP